MDNNQIKLLFDGAVFIDRKGFDNKRGMYYVAYNLLKHFMKDKRFDVSLWLDKNYSTKYIKEDSFLKDIKIVFSNFIIGQGENEKTIKNPKFNLNEYDAYFNVAHCMQLATSGEKPAIFNVLHDCVPVIKEFDFFKNKIGYEEYFKDFFGKLSDDVWTFCVSEHTKNDFLKYFKNLNKEKMTVTHLAPSYNLSPEKNKNELKKTLKKYNIDYDINSEYLFYLGSVNDPRKNLVQTIKCFLKFIEKYKITNLYFYLGGYGDKELKEKLEVELADTYNKYKDYIVFLGFIDEKDINILYSNSMFFAFLPLYEGFGIPILEAMASGVPVICSNNSSLSEVAGNSAISVDLNNEDEIINAFKTFYFDENLRNEYIKKGLERAELFNWDKTYKIITDKIIEAVSKKLDIPIFLSSDNNYAPYMAATIVSILENTTSYIEFYILDDNISLINKEKIISLKNKYNNFNIKFIETDSNKEFSMLEFNNNMVKHVNLSMFNRFLIPNIDIKSEKVIYLDTDIIANGDIKDLYNYDLKQYALGAIPGQKLDIAEICKSLLELDKDHKIFNSGVLLMNLNKFRNENIVQTLFKIEKEKREKILYPDQDILNVYFENNYIKIDKIYNYEAVENGLCNNYILRHYTGSLKPWQIHPDLDTELLKDKELFWYYLKKTPFYDEVINNCKYKTLESLHQARLQKLLEKHASKDPMKYIKNKYEGNNNEKSIGSNTSI